MPKSVDQLNFQFIDEKEVEHDGEQVREVRISVCDRVYRVLLPQLVKTHTRYSRAQLAVENAIVGNIDPHLQLLIHQEIKKTVFLHA